MIRQTGGEDKDQLLGFWLAGVLESALNKLIDLKVLELWIDNISGIMDFSHVGETAFQMTDALEFYYKICTMEFWNGVLLEYSTKLCSGIMELSDSWQRGLDR